MIYYLNKDELPAIPTPHDCVITGASIQEDILTLKFEEDISYHDSIKGIHPNAKSLTIKFHLIDPPDVYQSKRYKFPKRFGIYKGIDFKKIAEYSQKGRLEYLYHNVGFNSIIVKLWCKTSIIMAMQADYVEFEW